MNLDEISSEATRTTSIFLAANERLQAMSSVSWALQKLLTAYESSEVEAPKIQKLIDAFIEWQGVDRVKKLEQIHRDNMNEAARLTALLVGE